MAACNLVACRARSNSLLQTRHQCRSSLLEVGTDLERRTLRRPAQELAKDAKAVADKGAGEREWCARGWCARRRQGAAEDAQRPGERAAG